MMKSRFQRNKLAAGVSLVLASSMGGLQTTPASGAETIEEVVVMGIRGSLMRAQAIKMSNTSIVEAISAEDIGKLPDSSIAESLARLPGLAGERRNGRTSGLSVRGFKEDYVGTTMNGRELLGIGDNRGVEYDLYPSEIMSGAVVYKSPDASLSMMGIGGTVDLRTTRPLDSASTLTINATYEQNGESTNNPDFEDTGHRAALSFSQKFADDTIGVALALATTESPTQEERSEVWGYTQNANFGGAYTPNGHSTFARSSVLERDTAALVLQFRPTDKLDITADGLYIDFSDTGILRGFIEELPHGSVGEVQDGVAMSGTSSGFHTPIRSDPAEKLGDLKSFGVNLDFQATERMSLKLDVAHSESTKNDLRAESYAGVGRPGTATQGPQTIRDWQYTDEGLRFSNSNVDFSDYDMIKLAGPQAWGGSLAPITELQNSGVPGVSFAQAQDGFLNEAVFEEELDTIRLESIVELDHELIRSINFGVLYSDRTKSKNNTGAFLTASTFPSDDVIPQSFREGVADLSFAGLGDVVAYDALSAVTSDFYINWDAARLEPDRLGDSYEVSEEIWTWFFKADYESDYKNINIYGNFGMQMVDTDQHAEGFIAQTGADLFVQATPVEGGDSYRHWLPSFNINFDLGEGHIVRAALAKVISRARIDHLGPGAFINFRNNVFNVTNTDPEDGPWVSESGNAELKPLEANQFDVAYDWYFEDDGYVSVGYFYKDLKNWHRDGEEVVDFSQFYIPGFHQAVDTSGNVFAPATFQGINRFKEDGLTGLVKGIEFQATLPMRILHESLEGFGVVFSSSFTDGKLDDGSRVPGLSDETYGVTMFYEYGGFEFRIAGTKRSDYLSEERGGSNSLADVTRQSIELWDAQVSYDFVDSGVRGLEGLRVSLQAQNLTDEDDVNIDDDIGLVTKHQHYGANYLLTLNYSLW